MKATMGEAQTHQSQVVETETQQSDLTSHLLRDSESAQSSSHSLTAIIVEISDATNSQVEQTDQVVQAILELDLARGKMMELITELEKSK